MNLCIVLHWFVAVAWVGHCGHSEAAKAPAVWGGVPVGDPG